MAHSGKKPIPNTLKSYQNPIKAKQYFVDLVRRGLPAVKMTPNLKLEVEKSLGENF
jgi:hypothetical protein